MHQAYQFIFRAYSQEKTQNINFKRALLIATVKQNTNSSDTQDGTRDNGNGRNHRSRHSNSRPITTEANRVPSNKLWRYNICTRGCSSYINEQDNPRNTDEEPKIPIHLPKHPME